MRLLFLHGLHFVPGGASRRTWPSMVTKSSSRPLMTTTSPPLLRLPKLNSTNTSPMSSLEHRGAGRRGRHEHQQWRCGKLVTLFGFGRNWGSLFSTFKSISINLSLNRGRLCMIAMLNAKSILLMTS